MCNSVIIALQDVLPGNFMGRTAEQKARELFGKISDDVKTYDGMRNSHDILINKTEAVKELFDLIKENAQGRDRDKGIRAAVLSRFAEGHEPEEVKELFDLIKEKELLDLVKGNAQDRNRYRNIRAAVLAHLAEGYSLDEVLMYMERITFRPNAIDNLNAIFGLGGQFPAGAARAERIYEELPANLQSPETFSQIYEAIKDHGSRIEDLIKNINQSWGDDESKYVSTCAEMVARMAEAGALLEGPTRAISATVVKDDHEFLKNNELAGTPENPVMLDMRSVFRKEAFIEAAEKLNERCDVALLENCPGCLGSGSGYVVGTGFRGSSGLTVFWKNNNGVRRATLIHLRGGETPTTLISAIKKGAAENYNDTDIRVQSLNWLKVEPAGPMKARLADENESGQRVFEVLAKRLKAPLNIIDRPLADANPDPLGIFIDVQNAKILFTPHDAYKDTLSVGNGQGDSLKPTDTAQI